MAGEDDVRDDAGGTLPPAATGPAPIIDLGEDAVPVRPVKPLGPRRLARIQRELAERARELEELGAQPAGPELLEKQRRFAELAAQAEAANTGAAGEGRAGAAGTGTTAPRDAPANAPTAPPSADPVGVEPGPAEPFDRITVVFPDSAAPDGTDGHASPDPVHVDPALFSNRLAPEELAALTHIEILAPGEPEHHGSHSARDPAPPPDEAPGPPPGAAVDDEPVPPAAPVPATRAGGLELLEPREYRSRAGSRWWVLLLGLALAALVVLVVLDVL